MYGVVSELWTEESMGIQFLDKEILKTRCVHSVNKEIHIFIKRAENGCYKVNIILRLNYLWIYYNSSKNVELSRKMHSCMTPLNTRNMKSHFTKIFELYHESVN